MRLLLVGEGPHDIGLRQIIRNNVYEDAPGWLHVILAKLARTGIVMDITAIRSRDILLTDRMRRKNRPLPDGHGARALAAGFKAKTEGFDIVVFMADADTTDVRRWNDHLKWIRDGFSRVPSGHNPLALVACLPMPASESWLMADPEAWKASGLVDTSVLPSHPEACRGDRDDPGSNHPHRLFARVCKQAGIGDTRETRVAVTTASSMPAIARACPVSFRTFWNDLYAAGFSLAAPRSGG
jgi:hypothetical protein